MRSVFVSNCGDPFLGMFIYKLFKERWYAEVDEFLININNHCAVPQRVISEFLSLLSGDKKVNIIYHPRGIGNGMPITEMTLVSKADLVMLLEDDGFIFEKGAVNEQFQKIESDLTDIVGSPRGSCGQEIWEASKEKYKLDYSGYGDQGPNWWPNFFFCKRRDLLQTDLNFASKTFMPGEYCEQLDYRFKDINHGDTFVWACIQLRARGLRSLAVPQHKADPYEIQSKTIKEMNWHPTQQPFKWIHGGSLSAGWGGYLSGVPMTASDDSSLREMESRCAFWQIAVDLSPFDPDLAIQYKTGIDNLIANAKLDDNKINQKIKIYRDLINV